LLDFEFRQALEGGGLTGLLSLEPVDGVGRSLVEAVGAIGGQQENWDGAPDNCLDHGEGEVCEKLEGRAVHPVEVVDQDDQGTGCS
jgi:hypothetical protein